MRRMTGAVLAAIAGLVLVVGVVGAQQRPQMVVFYSATCGCCAKWIQHVRDAGFAVDATTMDDLAPVKAQHHVPADVQGCHTGLVAGYVIEGHVPAADIQRLLRERPAIAGLAVRGMPIGSPGMEGPDPVPYEVLAFDEQGRTEVFARHGR